jgi:hypothetical protein
VFVSAVSSDRCLTNILESGLADALLAADNVMRASHLACWVLHLSMTQVANSMSRITVDGREEQRIRLCNHSISYSSRIAKHSNAPCGYLSKDIWSRGPHKDLWKIDGTLLFSDLLRNVMISTDCLAQATSCKAGCTCLTPFTRPGIGLFCLLIPADVAFSLR